MDGLGTELEKVYGHKLRLRACGLLIEQNQVLLIKHLGIGIGGYMYAPPGGGIEFGESAQQALKREFLEETGLDICILKFLYVHEYIQAPLHAIELIFLVERISGNIKLGSDPEMTADNQILSELAFMNRKTIFEMNKIYLHHVFGLITDLSDLKNIQGYYVSG